MAQLGRKFVATDHDTEQKDYPDLPLGIYRFEIEASDVKDADGNVGLSVTNVVIEPEEYAGRKHFEYYNLEHSSVIAQEIGQKQFASLCRAVEVDEVDESEELHFKPYTAKIGMGKDSKKKNADGTPAYPAKPEIKRYYFPDEGNVPTPEIDANQPSKPAAANDNKPAPRAAAAAVPQQRAAGARPWGGKK